MHVIPGPRPETMSSMQDFSLALGLLLEAIPDPHCSLKHLPQLCPRFLGDHSFRGKGDATRPVLT